MSKVPSLSSYAECDDYLGGKESRPLAYKVRLDRDGADITVVHHTTAIVRYRPDGSVVLTGGGWRSATTKKHLNAYSGRTVWQSKFVWYVYDNQGEKVEFEDGIEFAADAACEA